MRIYDFVNTIVPTIVGLAGVGVIVSVLPETQYEYVVVECPLLNVSTLPAVA